VANPDGGLDAVRAGWVGRYAARSWVFSFDNADIISVQTLGSYLTLVDITPSPDGGLTLREEVCRFDSGFQAAGIGVHVRIDYPPGVSLTTPLSYDAQRFSTQTASAYAGYGAAPAGCTPGATAMAGGPVRPWLTNNMCDCPTTNAPPISARDCRVIDSDSDGQPGNTFTITTGGSVGVYNVAQEQPLALVNGYREGERLYAQRQYGDKTKVLSCTIDGKAAALSSCALGTVGACLPTYNPVEMLRIQPQQGCADIRQRELAWFERAQPAFPTGCVAPGQHY
jgi:hypothetical protein